jgi:hypothetical protein
MLKLFIGSFISLIIEKLLLIYFINISFYYDFIFFSCKNLFYLSIFEIAFGWFSYEYIYVDGSSILKNFQLLLSYELFIDDFVIIFENVKLKTKNEYWQYLKKIYRTHGKRFMLFKNYRNNLILNTFQLLLINFSLFFSILLIEIFILIIFLCSLSYLITFKINKKIVLKFNNYKMYLKGFFYDSLSTQKNKNFYIKSFILFNIYFFFKYFNIYYLFDIYICFCLLYIIILIFLFFYYSFFILYTFYFSFICILVLNLFLKNLRLCFKTFFMKFYLYVFVILFYICFFANKEILFELFTNNNFLQELFIKFILIIVPVFYL